VGPRHAGGAGEADHPRLQQAGLRVLVDGQARHLQVPILPKVTIICDYKYL
jgi:hypothetical protein